MMISAVVLAKNEERNIKECLAGLAWSNEIVVIDDYSDDQTVGVIRGIREIEGKTKIFQRRLNGNFSQQRNFGLEKTKGEWVLFVDADERVSERLKEEIKLAMASDKNIDSFFFRRIDFFLGKWLKHGEIGSVRILRLAKKGKGRWKRKVDETWEVDGPTRTFVNPLLHFPHPSLADFLTSINERSTLNAQEAFEEKVRVSFLDWFKPLAKFLLNYFFRAGFLDESQGFIFAVLMSFHSFLVRGKLYLLRHQDISKQK